jgi:hypothetical protein
MLRASSIMKVTRLRIAESYSVSTFPSSTTTSMARSYIQAGEGIQRLAEHRRHVPADVPQLRGIAP